VLRVPAAEIEQVIVADLQRHIASQNDSASDRNNRKTFDHEPLSSLVSRIEVHRTQLIISLKPVDQASEAETLSIPWQKPPSKRSRKILLPHGATREGIRPERAERRARLVSAIARGRRWLEEITTGVVKDAEQLAARERCTVRQVNLTLSLAFLAPPLVKAAVEGRLPRGINIERLRDPDPIWQTQFQDLGVNPS
jgi:hypothetical protein